MNQRIRDIELCSPPRYSDPAAAAAAPDKEYKYLSRVVSCLEKSRAQRTENDAKMKEENPKNKTK